MGGKKGSREVTERKNGIHREGMWCVWVRRGEMLEEKI